MIHVLAWVDRNAGAILVLLLLLAAMFLFSGCTETRTETASIERTRGVQAGQPVDLITTRQERATATTDLTVELGPLVQAAVSAAMGDVKGTLSGLAGQVQTLSAKPAPPAAQEIAALIKDAADAGGLDPSTGAALGGAGGLALLALREWMAHRQTKRDEDEAWDHIKQQATQAGKPGA